MTSRLCMAFHEARNVFCALPVPPGDPEHEGPHGWDYEAGKACVIKRSEWEADLEAHGLGDLADRFHAIVEENRG